MAIPPEIRRYLDPWREIQRRAGQTEALCCVGNTRDP
nr:MAG TPA: hypothetical protein [Caudoviricetes sp.]